MDEELEDVDKESGDVGKELEDVDKESGEVLEDVVRAHPVRVKMTPQFQPFQHLQDIGGVPKTCQTRSQLTSFTCLFLTVFCR